LVGKCKYCGKEIHWSKESGSWVPYEDEGRIIRHNCTKRVEIVTAPVGAPAKPPVAVSGNGTDVQSKPVQVAPLTAEEVYTLRRFVQALKVVA
jgi:hypothetical protein